MSTKACKMFRSLPPTCVPELRRESWGRLFGAGIRYNRERLGLSIDEAARLSGMEASEWFAIEQGYVPQQVDQVRTIAATLEIAADKVMNWVLLCREAWEL